MQAENPNSAQRVIQRFGGQSALAQLIGRSREELLEIPGFGESALHQLMDCLSRYHELETLIEHQDAHDRRMADAARTYQGYEE